MAPKDSPPGSASPRGTPAFLSRVMALPALNQAINTFYDTGRKNQVVGAAIRAAERSVQVAATGALPLATPLVERVGGWRAIDEWACRGLDRVEKAVPIINLPAEEIVHRTRKTVLATVAGDQVIVPDTLLEAVRSRANRVVDQLAEGTVMKQVTGVAETSLDAAERFLDSVLPRGKGDRRQSLVPGENVVTRTVQLGQRASHRLYRAAIRRMRPDLTYDLKATITLDMVVNYTRTSLLDQLAELAREPGPNENFSVVMSLLRWPVRTSSNAATNLAFTYDTVSVRGMQLVDRYVPGVTVSASRARANAIKTAQRVTMVLQQLGDTSTQMVMTRVVPLLQDVIVIVRDRLQAVSPLLQTQLQALRDRTLNLVSLLQKVVMDSAVPFFQGRVDLLMQKISEVTPALRATLRSLQEAAVDLGVTLRESVIVMLPDLLKRVETFIDSLPLEPRTKTELKENLISITNEARVWGSAALVMVRMTPALAVYTSKLTRRIVTQIVSDALSPETPITTPTTTTTTTTTTTPSPRRGLVPIKVTMLKPRKDKSSPKRTSDQEPKTK